MFMSLKVMLLGVGLGTQLAPVKLLCDQLFQLTVVESIQVSRKMGFVHILSKAKDHIDLAVHHLTGTGSIQYITKMMNMLYHTIESLRFETFLWCICLF